VKKRLSQLNNNKKIFFFFSLFLIFIFISAYFRLWKNDLPIPAFQSKVFFNSSIPEYSFYFQELKKNNIPIWNPFNGGGFPIIGEDHHGIFNLPNILLLKIFPFFLSLKIIYLFYSLLGATGTYLYLRKLKLKPIIASFGVLFWLLSGPYISSASNIFYFQAENFLPWLFILSSNLSSFQNLFLFTFVAALQFLSGTLDFSILTLFIIFFYQLLFLLFIKKEKKKEILSWLKNFLLSIILTLGLVAIKLFPLRHSLFTFKKPLLFFFSKSYSFPLIPSLFSPFSSPDFSLFVGITSLIIIISMVFLKKKSSLSNFIFFNIILALFLLLMIFPNKSPLYVLYLFPPFILLKEPLAVAPFFSWFIMNANSYILNALYSKKKFLVFTFCFLTLVELSLFFFGHLPREILTEKINSLSREFPFLEKIKTNQEKVFFLEVHKNNKNILPLQPNNNLFWNIVSLNNNFSQSQRFKIFNNFLMSEIEYYPKEKNLKISEKAVKLLSLYGIRYLISDTPISNMDLFLKQKNLYFYQISPSIKNKTTVFKAISLSTQNEIFKNLTSPKFNPLNTAITERKIENKKITVFPQTYFPGWKAKLKNGKVIEAFPVNLTQTGFEAKSEEIDNIFFSPNDLKIGGLISLFFIATSLLLYLKIRNLSSF